jgi:hypothetical protein
LGRDGSHHSVRFGRPDGCGSGLWNATADPAIDCREPATACPLLLAGAEQISDLVHTYVAPNPQKMQQAFQARQRVAEQGRRGLGSQLAFTNYNMQGDSMKLIINTANKGIQSVDVYDAANKQLVWTGRATKTLSPGKNQQKDLNNLDKAIAKLMKNFPPPMK